MNNRLEAGGGADEFFTRLGPGWPLTGHQRRRLAPVAAAALGAGWDPAALAAFVGANTAGIRSPAAVLAARLSPAELPAPPGRAWARPPWCGRCDEGTRRQQRADGADAGRCQRCHPLAASGAGETGRTPQVRINGRRSQTAVSGTPASVHAARQSRAPMALAQLPPVRDVAFLPPAGSCLCPAASAIGRACGEDASGANARAETVWDTEHLAGERCGWGRC